MVIQHNLLSQFSGRQLSISTGTQSKSMEKLSSGFKINRAADDAAGLSISEKMRWQVRGLDRASENAQDGISLIQTAEGALGETHSILQRMKELSVQAANDSNTETDRDQIQKEIDQLVSEIDRISSTTQYNTMNLLDGSFAKKDASSNSMQLGNVTFTFELVGVNGKIPSTTSTEAIGTNTFSSNEQNMANFVKQAASSAVAGLYNAYPDLFNNAATSGVKVGLEFGNIDNAGGTLAYASILLSYSSASTETTYQVKVDTSDYPPDAFSSMSDAKKADLAATIAHEMTHVAMYDTLTNGMLGVNEYPSWFIEGTAQTSSGDSGWVSNHLNPSSSDADIASYMRNSSYRDYGAGYIAAMYLGQLASGQSSVSSANIKNGLNTVLGELASGKTLNEVIKEKTPYQGVADFEDHVFSSADAETKDFVHKLLNARGANGQGSLLAASLSTPKTDAFAHPSGAGSNYELDTSAKEIKNKFSDGFNPNYGGVGEDTSGTAESKGALKLQVGSLSGQSIDINIEAMNAARLGVRNLSMASFEKAGAANARIDRAIEKVSIQRAQLGAYQNRLEHTINNLENGSENTQAAESRIRDTDMAKEMMKYSVTSILAQAGQSMLTQANQSTQGILSILQ